MRPRSDSDAHTVRSRRTVLLALAVAAVVAAGAVGVAVGANGSEDATPTPYPGLAVAHTTPMATAVSAQQRDAFGVLRQDVTGSDALPASTVAKDLTNSLSVKLSGMNATLARRAASEAGAVWVVPGNGSTCLVINTVPVGPSGTALKQDTSTCVPDERAARGELVASVTYNDRKPSHEFVAGLVPDGVSQVAVQLSDGSTQTIGIHDNVYTDEFDGATATTVAFDGPAGAIVVHP